MKKITVLFISLIIMASLTACANADNPAPDIADEDKLTIKMEFDKDYDDADPFVNEKLFTVSEDMETLIAEGTLNLDGESVILEVKNNKTKEILWSSTWDKEVQSDTFSISLKKVKAMWNMSYVSQGKKINHAAVEITF